MGVCEEFPATDDALKWRRLLRSEVFCQTWAAYPEDHGCRTEQARNRMERGEIFVDQPQEVDQKGHFDKNRELKEDIHKRDMQIIGES